MKTFLKGALSLALAAALLGPAAPSAFAGTGRSGPATLTATGGFVAPGACQNGPARYQLLVDEAAIEGYDEWSADITVTGPGGYYETGFLWEDEGWNKVFFCDSPNRAGTYTVTADVEISHWDDYEYMGSSTYQTVSTTFKVTGPARSAVAFAKKPYRAHGWKFPVRVTRAGKPWSGRGVTMQMKMCGSWRKVITKRTGATGRVTFYATPAKEWNTGRACGVRYARAPFRFRVAGNFNTRPSTSTIFRVARR